MITIAGMLTGSHLVPSQVRAEAPKLPPATSTVTSSRPTLETYSVGYPAVSFEVCGDPACVRVIESWTDRSTTRVPSALSPGMYFWRTAVGEYDRGRLRFPRGPWGTTRPFRVPPRPRESAKDTFWGGFLDVNCDGFGDAAVSTQDPRTGRSVVEVFHGAAEVLSASAAWSLPISAPIHDVSPLGDLNNDGCGELGIVGNGMVAVHPGSPEGLGAPAWMIARPPDARPDARLMMAAAGSVDRKGSELVLHGGGMVWIYAGDESLSLTPGRTYGGPSEPGFETNYGGAGDFNGDGYGDLVLVRSHERQVQHIRVVPGHVFGPWDPDEKAAPSTSGPSSCVGDVDADGVSELMLAGPASAADGKQSGVSIYRGSWTPPTSIVLSATPLQQIEIPTADLHTHCADVNGDGRDDLLVRRHDLSTTGRSSVRVSVYLAGSDGHLALSQTLREEDYVGDLQTDFAADISASDLNGDGRLELVLTAPAVDVNRSGLLLIFGDARGDDLGSPTVRTGSAGFAQRLALGFR